MTIFTSRCDKVNIIKFSWRKINFRLGNNHVNTWLYIIFGWKTLWGIQEKKVLKSIRNCRYYFDFSVQKKTALFPLKLLILLLTNTLPINKTENLLLWGLFFALLFVICEKSQTKLFLELPLKLKTLRWILIFKPVIFWLSTEM